MLCDNLNALAVLCAAGEAPDTRIELHYRLNRTYAFAHLKRCLPRWLLKGLPTLQQVLAVFRELARNLIRFVPGASKPGPQRPKPHMHHAYRPTT